MRRLAGALCVVVLLGCSDDKPSLASVCDAFDDFLDDEATGTRTVEEGRSAYQSQVHQDAQQLDELKEASNEVLRGYSYYVDNSPQASSVLEAGFSDFSVVCHG